MTDQSSSSAQTDPPPDEPEGFSIPPKVTWIAGGVLALAVITLVAWYGGMRQGRAEVEQLHGEIDESQARVSALESRMNILEGRRLLHQAVLELEARNFGSAQERVRRATQFFAAGAEAVTDEGYDATLTQLREFEIKVDPDVGTQVTNLVRMARSLDQQLPPPPKPLGEAPAPSGEQPEDGGDSPAAPQE